MVCLCAGCSSAEGVEFQDALMERCVREALNKGVGENITAEECAALTSLKIDCSKDYSINYYAQRYHLVSYVDLSDLKYLTGLKELEINNNRPNDVIANLEAITHCTNLEKLSMRVQLGSDSPLTSWGWCYGYKYLGSIVEKLPNLKTINLNKDIPTAVQSWIRGSNTQLTIGNAGDYPYEDTFTEKGTLSESEKHGVYYYEKLSEIPKDIEDLILVCQNVESLDFNELKDFGNLKTLSVFRPCNIYDNENKTEIKNVEALSKLKGLYSLTLNGCKGDFTGLGKLSNLKELGIMQSVVEDTSFLKKMENLRELWYYTNLSTDLEDHLSAAAEKLTKLKFIYIPDELGDYSWLSKISSLEAIRFAETPYTQVRESGYSKNLIGELAKCEGVKYLCVDHWRNNEFDPLDISGIAKMPNLKLLGFTESAGGMTGYDEIIDMPSLVGLVIYGNEDYEGLIQHCLDRGADNKNLSYIFVRNVLVNPYMNEANMAASLSYFRDTLKKCFDNKLTCGGYDSFPFDFATTDEIDDYVNQHFVPTTEPVPYTDPTSSSVHGGETVPEPENQNWEYADAEEMVIYIYDTATDYAGIQEGWYADVIKERFNIKLNIITPWVEGASSFEESLQNGNPGDIVILNRPEFETCVNAGILRDITDDLANYPNLVTYKDQIVSFNKKLEINDDRLYGIPSQMTNTSPTTYSEDMLTSSPLLRWDMYQELGTPEINDLDGLLNVLQQMQNNHPEGESGEAAYPFILWGDWDNSNNMMGLANVTQLTTWYGEKVKDSAIRKIDGTYTRITDKNATYYRILKFYNKAYQMGLVDPDSATQDFTDAYMKALCGRMYLMSYSWLSGVWNTPENNNAGRNYVFVPISDQTYYTEGDNYYGTDIVWGIAKDISDEKYERIMAFLDWYASPEGVEFQYNGIEGFNYRKLADGRFELIYENENAEFDNPEITGTAYTGKYTDGMCKINQGIVSATSIDPNTGEGYGMTYWQSYKDTTSGRTDREWKQKYGAASPVDWMQKNGKLTVTAITTDDRPGDTDEIYKIRRKCEDLITEASWAMIYAETDTEFETLWDNMANAMEKAGYEKMYQFDVERDQNLTNKI